MKHILPNNLERKHSLVMKFGQILGKNFGQKKFSITKEKNLSKKFMKNVTWKLIWFQAFYNFQKILCKKESEEVFMLNLTNFDTFAVTYLI